MPKVLNDWALSEEAVPEIPQIVWKKHCPSQQQCGSYASSVKRNKTLSEIYLCLSRLSCF